jgi:hypothetical protein
MHIARNRSDLAHDQTWSTPKLRQLGQLSEQELSLVRDSDDPKASFGKILTERRDFGDGWASASKGDVNL